MTPLRSSTARCVFRPADGHRLRRLRLAVLAARIIFIIMIYLRCLAFTGLLELRVLRGKRLADGGEYFRLPGHQTLN